MRHRSRRTTSGIDLIILKRAYALAGESGLIWALLLAQKRRLREISSY